MNPLNSLTLDFDNFVTVVLDLLYLNFSRTYFNRSRLFKTKTALFIKFSKSLFNRFGLINWLELLVLVFDRPDVGVNLDLRF